MTTHTHQTVLTRELRARVAADAGIGGGNLLQSMLAINPYPDEPFIHSLTPVPYTDGETRTDFSLRDLDHLVQSWSVWYRSQGVRPKDRVAIFLPDSIAYFVHYSAIAQLGAIAVLINWKAPRESAVALCERTGAIGLYTDLEHMDRMRPDLDRLGLRWITTIEEMPSPPSATLSDEARFRHHPDDPVGMMHSSGTTGLPKPVIHTHRTILEGPKFRAVDYVEEPDALIMTALPQSHQGTISFTSYAVLTGQPLLAWRDVTGDELAAAIPEHGPTMVMAFGHAYPELAALETPPGALDSVNIWVSMGDAVHERHLKNVLARRSAHLPPAAFLDRLGTTELGWGVLMQPRTLATQRNDRCVGRSVGFAEVAILRQNGTVAEPYECGLLGAKPPSMTVGYWGNQETYYRSILAGYWLTRRRRVPRRGRLLLSGRPRGRRGAHAARARLLGADGGTGPQRGRRSRGLHGRRRRIPRPDGGRRRGDRGGHRSGTGAGGSQRCVACHRKARTGHGRGRERRRGLPARRHRQVAQALSA